MITSIQSVTGQETRISSEITQEVEFLSSTLSLLRDSEKISNDEFLEAGLIQGGLNLLSAMISNGVETEELEIQITSLKDRALLICQRFPNLDEKIESMRLPISRDSWWMGTLHYNIHTLRNRNSLPFPLSHD